MKTVGIVTLLLALAVAPSRGMVTDPIAKILEMLGSMQAKIITEGHEAQNMYAKFSEWCEDRSQELHFEIKSGKSEVASLKAAIEKATADIEALDSKISDSGSDASEAEADLKKAESLRASEHEEFIAVEKELVDTVDMLERAMSIIRKEMKGGAFLQAKTVHTAKRVVEALRAMVEASSIHIEDATKLTALIQGQRSSAQDETAAEEEEEEEEDEVGAPSAAAYESSSGAVIETIQGLLDKADSQLDKARKEEQASLHEFEMKKQSLEDQASVSTKALTEAKSELEATKEKKAVAGGDMQVTSKDVKEEVKELEELHHTCLAKAQDFEEETTARGEEISALAKAKKILEESTGGATDQAYGLVDTTSFVQVKMKTRLSESGAKSLRMVRKLAYAQRSTALAQLASRMQSAFRFGSLHGGSPFKKVQGMIADMIASLEKEADSEASEKEYCDKEMAETTAKLEDKTDESKGLTTKVAQMEGASVKLKSEVAALQKEVGALMKSQAEMDQLRQTEKATFEKNKPEMEQGLKGVKMALRVLKEYYAKPALLQARIAFQNSAKGPDAIISLLEVAESDFSKMLAEMVAEEESAQSSYETTTKENEVMKTTKEQEVKFKTKEYAGLDKSAAEMKSDASGVSDELSAIKDYYKQLQGRCVAKPPSYQERKERREAEIQGLKDALDALEGDAMLLQEHVSHRILRGVRRH